MWKRQVIEKRQVLCQITGFVDITVNMAGYEFKL